MVLVAQTLKVLEINEQRQVTTVRHDVVYFGGWPGAPLPIPVNPLTNDVLRLSEEARTQLEPDSPAIPFVPRCATMLVILSTLPDACVVLLMCRAIARSLGTWLPTTTFCAYLRSPE